MRSFIAALAVITAASPLIARAADKPTVGPRPVWVVPKPVPTTPADLGKAPQRTILADLQVDFSGSTMSIYQESAIQITSPEGLTQMGTIKLTWQPSTDVITVNQVRILRDGKPIDVPHAEKDFTVLRRENGLEYSMLNGILTATLQIEGLQVGDIVDIAYTLTRTQTIFKGHHDTTLDAGTSTSLQSLYIRASWAPGDEMVHRTTNLPAALAADGKTGLSLTASEVQPPVLPQGAPTRFRIGRVIELSDYDNWGQVSAIFVPLFDKARTLAPDSQLKQEIATIRGEASDPVKQASMALALVESKIRYLYIGLNQSDYVPADADATWKRRFGDCKAKTALLLALLDGLGIEAEPALVSTKLGDGMDQRLPNVSQFDHVIVRAQIGDKTYWLDGTRQGDTSITHLEVPDYHWALPIATGTDKLEALVVPPRTEPTTVLDLRLDASKGIFVPAQASATETFHGDAALGLEQLFSAVPASQVTPALKQVWLRNYDFITPDSVDQRFDPSGPTLTLTMHGTAKMDWNTAKSQKYYELDNAGLGFTPDYHRDPGPNQHAPFAIEYPDYTLNRETVVLPGRGGEFTIGDDAMQVDQTLAERAFRRKVTMKGNVVTMEASARPLKPELPYDEAIAAAAKLSAMADTSAYINVASYYALTQDDAKTILANTTGKAQTDFGARVNALLYLKQFPEMLAEAQRYVSAFPNSAEAYASRGMAYIANHDKAKALADADKALSIESGSVWGKAIKRYLDWQAQVASPEYEGRTIWPDLLGQKFDATASSCLAAANYDCAIDFSERAIARNPTDNEAYLTKANVYMRLGNPKQAAAQADLMVKSAPDDPDMLAFAGTIHCSTGECDKGMKDFAKSLAIEPNITSLINRARFRPVSDVAGRKQDLETAYKLAPKSADVLTALADFYHRTGDHADEIKILEGQQASAGPGFDSSLKTQLARAYAEAGLADKASGLFAQVRGFAAGTQKAADYNDLCYSEAQADFDLTTALSDCRQAIALDPDDAAILDSLGFVQLRLKQYKDAVASYDKVIAKAPHLAVSIYGRALAHAALGDSKAALADFSSATKIDPNVIDTFRDMGISPPSGIKTPADR